MAERALHLRDVTEHPEGTGRRRRSQTTRAAARRDGDQMAIESDGVSDEDDDPPPDATPLTVSNALGRRVLVPRAMWPAYACDEHMGVGWTATVVRCTAICARVSFVRATTPRGLPYEDVDVALDALRPL